MNINVKSFREFIKSDGSYRTLNEGLTEIKHLACPHMTLQDALILEQYSPKWKPSMMYGKIGFTVKPAVADAISEKMAEEGCEDFSVNKMSGKSGAAAEMFSYDIPDGYIAADFRDNVYSILSLLVKKLRPDMLKTDGGKLIAQGDAEFAKKAYLVQDFVKSNPDEAKKLCDNVKEMLQVKQQMQDKSVSPEKKKELIQYVKSTGAQIVQNANAQFSGDIPDNKKQDFERTKISADDTPVAVEVTGPYNCLMLAYMLFVCAREGKSLDTVREMLSGVNQYSFKKPAYNNISSNNGVNSLAEANAEYEKEFHENLKLTENVDDYTRWLLKMCDNELSFDAAAEKKKAEQQISFINQKLQSSNSPDEKTQLGKQLEYARSQLIKAESAIKTPITVKSLIAKFNNRPPAFYMNQYKRRRDTAITDVQTAAMAYAKKEFGIETKEEFEAGKFSDDIKEKIAVFTKEKLADVDKTIPELNTLPSLDEMRKNAITVTVNTGDEQPNLQNACAKRRMKLFEDLQWQSDQDKTGKNVYTSKNWVIGFAYTPAQARIFGRNKPKASNEACTEYYQQANLRNDENITPEMRRLRDSDAPHIKDGIGFDSYRIEASWCTSTPYYASSGERHNMGWTADTRDNMFYSYLTRNSGKAYLIVMECSNGALTQFIGTEAKNEADSTSSGLVRRCNSSIMKACDLYPELHQLLKNADFMNKVSRLNGSSVSVKSPEQIIEDALTKGDITRTGQLKVKSRSDVMTKRSIFRKFDEIYVDREDASSMFYREDASQPYDVLPVINCEKVRIAYRMFYEVEVANHTIRLANTGHIHDMSEIFTGAHVEKIEGLDTSSATTIRKAFMHCRPKIDKLMHIPELNLVKCSDIAYAFNDSAVQVINLKNTENIKCATDAFIACAKLENMPDIRFPLVILQKALSSKMSKIKGAEFSGDFSLIFDGCVKLQRKMGDKFDQTMDEVKAWYVDKLQKTGKNLDVFEIPAPIDQDDDGDFTSYKKVILPKTGSLNGMFSDNGNIRIRTLDVNGNTDISYLFRNCIIKRLDRIVGTENVTDANSVFYRCTIQEYPALDLPRLTGQMTVYKNCNETRAMPIIRFGMNVKKFDTNDIEIICMRMFGDTVQDWLDQYEATADKYVHNLYLDPLNAAMDRATSQLSAVDGVLKITDENYNSVQTFMRENADSLKTLCKDGSLTISFAGYKGNVDSFFANMRLTAYDLIVDLTDQKSAKNMFESCAVIKKLTVINSSKLTDANYMFASANIASLSFTGCDSIIDGKCMFKACYIANADIGVFKSLENGDSMFMYSGIKMQIANESLQKLKYASYMFAKSKIKFGGMIQLPAAVDMTKMFQGTDIKNLTKLSAPEAITMQSIFWKCENLVRIGTITAPKCVNFGGAFSDCKNIQVIHSFVTSKNVQNIQSTNMFGNTLLANVYGTDGRILLNLNARRKN